MTGRHGKTARMEMVICFHKVDDLEGDDNWLQLIVHVCWKLTSC